MSNLDDKIRRYEEIINQISKQKEKLTDIQKFLSDESIKALIQKYVNAKMSEDNIIKMLNHLLESDEIKEQFGIEKDKRLIVKKKHIRKIISEFKKGIKDEKKMITQSNEKSNENTNKLVNNIQNNIQGAGKAKPILTEKTLDFGDSR